MPWQPGSATVPFAWLVAFGVNLALPTAALRPPDLQPQPPPASPRLASDAAPRRNTSAVAIGEQATAVLVLSIVCFVFGYLRHHWPHHFGTPSGASTRGGEKGPGVKQRRPLGPPSQMGAPGTFAVIVEKDKGARFLQVKKELVSSYEDLRFCIVEALPDVFDQATGDLRMAFEYQRYNGKWCRCKKSTPIDKLKEALRVRVRVVDDPSWSAPKDWGSGGGRQPRYGKVRVVSCSVDEPSMEVL